MSYISCAPGQVRVSMPCSGTLHNGVCTRCGQRVDSTGGQHSVSFDPYAAVDHVFVMNGINGIDMSPRPWVVLEPADRQLRIPGYR